MPRCAIGVTYTPEERAKMNLPPLGAKSVPLSRLDSHETTVSLPDGTCCCVSFRRFGARSHRFVFGTPLTESVWLSEPLINTAPSIEQKAQELALTAFTQAMAEEQRLMRRKSIPKGAILTPGEPPLQAKTAALFGGHYAVCILFSSGRLSAIGAPCPAHDQPLAALQDDTFAHVQLFGQQRLVIGICCRYLRRWVEPQFLPLPRAGANPDDQADADL